MSKIPFPFIFPIPTYFKYKGYLRNPKNVSFLCWSFFRCSHSTRTIFMYSSQLILEPFEFVFGRDSCSSDTNLTPMEIRIQLRRWIALELLSKVKNKSNSRYTVYKWMTDRFVNFNQSKIVEKSTPKTTTSTTIKRTSKLTTKKTSDFSSKTTSKINSEIHGNLTPHNDSTTDICDSNPQQTFDENNQQILSDLNPLNNHQKNQVKNHESELIDLKENQSSQTLLSFSNDLTDFLSAADEMQPSPPKRKSLLPPVPRDKILVSPGVLMSKEELEACIAIKGSRESVENAVGIIMRSPQRRFAIRDWPKALTRWEIKNEIVPMMREHEALAQTLESEFYEFVKGWRCRIFHDRKKDQKGLLFECESAFVEAIFVPFIDKDFIKNCQRIIVDRKMQKSRMKN